MTRVSPQDLIEHGLRAAGGDQAIVLVSEQAEANLRWARGTLTTNGEMSSTTVTVIAFADTATGTATASLSGPVHDAAEVADLVAAAQARARDSAAADDAAPLIDGAAAVDWSVPAGITTAEVFAPLTPALGEVLTRGRADGIEHVGYAEHRTTTTYLGSTTGMRRRHEQAEARLELTAKSHDRTRSTWVGQAGETFVDVDLPSLDTRLRRALDWQGTRVEVEPGRQPVLLSPSATADLMIELYWAADAREAGEGRSAFSRPGGGTRLGDRLGPAGLHLLSDPALPGLGTADFVTAAASSGTASVFDNGLPLARTSWVTNGHLDALVGSRHAAATADVPLTPGIDNLALAMDGATGDLNALVARTDRALLITCLWYIRPVDPQTLLVTGLTRDGVYLVEGGEIVGAVGNFRFNDSPLGLLDRIGDVTTAAPTLAREMGDYFPRASMPAVRVDGFHLSTRSQAQ